MQQLGGYPFNVLSIRHGNLPSLAADASCPANIRPGSACRFRSRNGLIQTMPGLPVLPRRRLHPRNRFGPELAHGQWSRGAAGR